MVFQRYFVIAFFCLVFISNHRVLTKFSTTSVTRVGRIEPIRLFASNKPASIPNVHTRSESVSSVSSFSTLASETSFTQPKPIQTDPIPSTSSSFNGVEIRPNSQSEHRPISESELYTSFDSERQPMIERAKHVRFMESIDLHDASRATHSNGNINPARDGVFARVRGTVLRFAAAAAVGTAIGATGAVITRNFIQNNNNVNEVTSFMPTTEMSEELRIPVKK